MEHPDPLKYRARSRARGEYPAEQVRLAALLLSGSVSPSHVARRVGVTMQVLPGWVYARVRYGITSGLVTIALALTEGGGK